MGTFSIVTFAGSLIVIPTLLARLPSDFFLRTAPRPGTWRARHPVWRWAGRVGKNLLGGVLVLCGVAMLVLPGQGIITILIGLGLLDIPGKRALELALLRRPVVSRVVNWIRAKAHRPPLRLPPAHDGRPSPENG